MNLLIKNIAELLDIALKTTSFDEMLLLKNHSSMSIRRNLARNSNLNQEIINSLLYDPVENVSYIASINPNNKNFKRTFANLRPCVLCNKNQSDCDLCQETMSHSF